VEHSRVSCTGPIVIQQGVLQNSCVARPLPLPALIATSVLLPTGLRILCDVYWRGGRGPGIVKEGFGLHVNEVHDCNSGSDVAIRVEKEGDFEKSTGNPESGPKLSTAPHVCTGSAPHATSRVLDAGKANVRPCKQGNLLTYEFLGALLLRIETN
jgi:hypothetical protein